MRGRITAWLMGLLVSSAAHATPLTLDEVLASAEARFPLLEAARLEADALRFERMEARGAFDARVSVAGDLRLEGFYENYAGTSELELPTRLWGLRLYGRYRYGEGDFGSYDGARLTDDQGEAAVGVALPLLRGGATDPQRAAIDDAAQRSAAFAPGFTLERVRLERDASLAYWDWVAAGRKVEIAETLLGVADARQDQIARRVDRGADPEILLDDNRRLVIERRGRLRGAERDFRQAALRLSLFLRAEDGTPRVVGRDALPSAFPEETPTDAMDLDADLETVRRAHPELQRIAIDRERLEIALRLARNELLPAVDLAVEGSRDFGDPRPGIDETGKLSADPRGDTEIKATVRFEIPIQRREARGRVGVARIRLAQLEQRERFLSERIVAEIRQAIEALDAAFDQTGQARENFELAERLRRAEMRKLEFGLSNLIDVNIREVQAATAARELVDAQAAYFRAVADYDARVANAPERATSSF